MRHLTRLTGLLWLAGLVVSISCATPPHKEIDQAQGAIDAAKAAGAERFAPTEYAAAIDALKQANDAVTGRDYRLALNQALESREQAQNAARTAADTRATLRGNVERSRAEVKALITQTRARLAGPDGLRMPRRARRAAEQRLTQLDADLQKADAALRAEDYMGAERVLTGVKERILGVVGTISRASTSQSLRTRRKA